jgi:glycosyltransferase involved in cell wall biosynthesis
MVKRRLPLGASVKTGDRDLDLYSSNSTACLPRVAFCTDTFHETNGVATISREFAAFLQKNGIEAMLVRPGAKTRKFSEGSLTVVELGRSLLCLPLDMGFQFDLLVSRHFGWLKEQMSAFAPDIVHITGPGDIGMICARMSKVIRTPDVPLVAGWHTNLHQYARLRAAPLFRWLPGRAAAAIGAKIEAGALWGAGQIYRTASVILAPNEEILAQLAAVTGKPVCLMPHGVSTDLFVPDGREISDVVTLGYVGRLTAEKNVRLIAEVEQKLPADVRNRVRFLIVGHGGEQGWLESRLPTAVFKGVLRDQALADAYAAMDVFLFPSKSDTLGLVVLEAMSCGVPVVAFRLPGPRSTVLDGETGFTVEDTQEFVDRVAQLVRDSSLRCELGVLARKTALGYGWDGVFGSFYDAYATVFPTARDSVTSVTLEV